MLADVAEELYGLTPGEFTAARNQRARNAKAAGDAELAREIGRLPKPSVAAWVVNLLARQRPETLNEVIELGEALREAQDEGDRDRLKELSRERQETLRSAAATAVSLAGESGHKVPPAATAEVEQTLQAAMADPHAAAAVRTGRLTRTLASTGIEPVDLADAVAGPVDLVVETPPDKPRRPRSRTTQKPPEDRAFQRRLDQAQAQLESAEREAENARQDLVSADTRLRSLEPERERLASALDELKRQIVQLEHDIAALDHESAVAERVRAKAERRVADSERSAREARQRLERLSG